MSHYADYLNNQEKHERKIGRYWATDIYRLKKGYLTVDNFFERSKIDDIGAENICTGLAYEDFQEKVWKGKYLEYNPKTLIDIDDFTLTIKPDFVFEKCVIETKAPVKQTWSIPDKWKDQLECEYRAYEKKVYLGVFGNNPTRRISMHLFPYKPSDVRWKNIQKRLKVFNQELIKKYGIR